MSETELPKQLVEKVDVIPVDELIEHPENPNEGDVGAIYVSIVENGFFDPLKIQRSTNYVLDGNHTLKAARQLKFKELPCIVLDVDDETALRILIAANRTAELAKRRPQDLIDLLSRLATTEKGLLGTAYDGDDLDALILNPGKEWEGMPEFKQDDLTGITLVVHFANEDDRKEFGKVIGRELTDKTRSIWYPEQELSNRQNERYATGE